jgi:hypothetical protein
MPIPDWLPIPSEHLPHACTQVTHRHRQAFTSWMVLSMVCPDAFEQLSRSEHRFHVRVGTPVTSNPLVGIVFGVLSFWLTLMQVAFMLGFDLKHHPTVMVVGGNHVPQVSRCVFVCVWECACVFVFVWECAYVRIFVCLCECMRSVYRISYTKCWFTVIVTPCTVCAACAAWYRYLFRGLRPPMYAAKPPLCSTTMCLRAPYPCPVVIYWQSAQQISAW